MTVKMQPSAIIKLIKEVLDKVANPEAELVYANELGVSSTEVDKLLLGPQAEI